jgi:hypothetical protein
MAQSGRPKTSAHLSTFGQKRTDMLGCCDRIGRE